MIYSPVFDIFVSEYAAASLVFILHVVGIQITFYFQLGALGAPYTGTTNMLCICLRLLQPCENSP